MGVHLWFNTKVLNYDSHLVQIQGNKNLPAKTVIWSAGVIANPIPGSAKEYLAAKRIPVDEYNRVQGETSIFAIGDVAGM